jgi:ribosomal-protein-alanine N-acetyltransferase
MDTYDCDWNAEPDLAWKGLCIGCHEGSRGRGDGLANEREGTARMSKSFSTKSCVHIRWMIRRDMPCVLGIEAASFEFPWTEDEFLRCLRQRDCIGMVAEQAEQVVGFMIYELHRTRIHVLSFAVHPDFRRQSVGRTMMEKLVAKLAYQRRNRIVLEVRETNLPAQLFFRSLGFKATGVLRNFYEDSTEDAFMMQYRSASISDDAIDASEGLDQRRIG